MSRLIATLSLLAAIPLFAGAEEPGRFDSRTSFRPLQEQFTVPAEWSGIWSIVDSTYDCDTGFLFSTDTGLDTLCTGLTIDFAEDSAFPIACSGTITETVVDVTCDGVGEAFPDCEATITIEDDAVRTGDSYTATVIVTTVTQGTGEGSGFTSCSRTVTHGTRIAPEPAAHCATVPARESTWGG